MLRTGGPASRPPPSSPAAPDSGCAVLWFLALQLRALGLVKMVPDHSSHPQRRDSTLPQPSHFSPWIWRGAHDDMHQQQKAQSKQNGALDSASSEWEACWPVGTRRTRPNPSSQSLASPAGPSFPVQGLSNDYPGLLWESPSVRVECVLRGAMSTPLSAVTASWQM